MENKFKLFVIIAIVVLALAIAGSTFFVLKVFNSNQIEAATASSKAKAPNLKAISLGESILTNIATDGGSVQHFAKVQISIGVDSSDEKTYAELETKITNQSASVRNALITTIGEQTYSMLNGANGKEKLADEIITRLNTLLDTDLIYEVYFEEYFIQ